MENEQSENEGWCRGAGTENESEEEPRLVERLNDSEGESGGSQKVVTAYDGNQTPAAPNIPDAQLRDENTAPILIAKLQSNGKPKLEEIFRASENVKKLWSEWERLEVVDGALYRRREPTGRPSNLQLIVWRAWLSSLSKQPIPK